MLLGAYAAGCGSDDDNSGTSRAYSGSASAGDIVTFSINPSDNTYRVENSTTGRTETGSYTVMASDELSGIKKVTSGSKSFFAVELTDKVIAANFPTGNDNNDISFGVSSAFDNTGKESSFAGNYIWIHMSDKAINGSTDNREWGAMTLSEDGHWYKKNYASGGSGSITVAAPEELTSPFPVTDTAADEKGTWAFSGTHQERVDVTVDGTDENLSGFAYIGTGTAVFLIDLGTGSGFLLAFQVPSTALSLSDVAGSYKAVTVESDGTLGAINFTLNSSGSGTYYHINESGETSSGALSSFGNPPSFGNLFHGQTTGEDALNVYLIFTGDIIMFFCFDQASGDFVIYGAGAKI